MPANGETPHLMHVRWAKLRKDLYKPKKDQFDTSKLPDLYDNAMHDVIHNAHLNLRALPELYHAARTIAAYVVPQEYGISAADKVGVGVQIASTMLHKIHDDMLAGMATESHERERVH